MLELARDMHACAYAAEQRPQLDQLENVLPDAHQ